MTPDTATPFALHLLHLEDDLDDADLTHRLLKKEWPACEITAVHNRSDYVAALENGGYDLILADFSLPSFGGLDALDLARRQGSGTPFLFFSGGIGEDDAVEAVQRGATDYVTKDRPDRLITSVRRALNQNRERALRRRAEQRLREQAELLDKAREAICVADFEGRITYWNKSAGQLFGEGDGRRLKGLAGLFSPAFVAGALRQIQTHGAWTEEIRVAAAGNVRRDLETRWTLVRDDEDRPKSILLIIADVTEKKILEAQVLRSQRMEGIGTLAGGIAHDLNNALAPILMALGLLQERTTDPDSLRLLGVLETSAKHGADLIRQVLMFARGAGSERTEVRIEAVIRDVVALLRETLPRVVEIGTEWPPDLWPVSADSTQLNQVLMNLGINARDAMPGSGRLDFQAANVLVDEKLAAAHPGAKAGPHVLIRVTDTGCGIPPDALELIFNPFFTTKKIGKGTGLGLSTVLGIVKAHHGFVQVKSVVGRGTEFSIYLPAAAPVPPPPAAASRPAPPRRGGGETILVLDDEEGVRKIARAVLLAFGYRVLEAEDGPSGLALYRQHGGEIDAVLTDMTMPGMEGREVVQALRALDPDVRVVVMSGMSSEGRGMEAEPGRLAFLSKPMTATDLLRAIQSVLPPLNIS